ncbi:zinc-binding dehydrogenase, partial [Enterococcus faecalis]|uniref:zinc-binding dehydrogenase n=1 Tax=Enterococcus faecalis TaxID=1351 RepID=UPI003D6AE411
GGVGTYAIQLAKEAGAHVITTASAKNHAILTKIGADEVIDYHTTNFAEVFADVDLVFDTMGGEVQENSFDVLKPNTGRLVTIVGIENKQLAAEKNITAESNWLQPKGTQLQK